MAVNRINEFLEAAKTSTDLETLVKNELEYLDNELTLSSKKRALTRYRNAVRVMFGNDSIVLKTLKLAKQETIDLNVARKVQIRATSDSQVGLDLEKYLEVAIPLIADRKSYTKVATGLFALTGRRPYEILKTASMTAIDNDWIVFAGQAKKAKSSNDLESKPYEMPVLTDSNDIVEALNFIRKVRDFSDLDSDAIHSKCNKTLNETCKKLFTGIIPDPSPKMLRKAYSEVASYWFKDDSQEKNAFLADILGHQPLDIEVSQTYKKFYILD